MIEQDITRLVSQSEKKGRFIIQELDEDINVMENYENSPINFFDKEKNFTKKTKHSSICNNNKIIHLLHNQSENPNLNQNFSTFIFEENSKNWIDFDLLWNKFSRKHCDVSENNMEKIFNYTDIKSDVEKNENNSSYFNDSLNVNNNLCEEYNENQKLILSNENININIDLEKNKTKNFVLPSNDNLTNIQTTHDISHSNIADIGMLSNTTANQINKNLCENYISVLNNNANNNLFSTNNNFNNRKLSLNNNLNYNVNINNNFANNNKENIINNQINNIVLFNNGLSNINSNTDNSIFHTQITIAAETQLNENEKESIFNTICNIETINNNGKEDNCQSQNKKNNIKEEDCLEINYEKQSIDKLSNENEIEKLRINLNSNANPIESNKNLDIEISNCEAYKSPKNTIQKSYNNSKVNSNDKKEKLSQSPTKIKNLEINFCEKRIINSPAFSPINSDYCHKLDKLNLDLHSLNDISKKNVNNNINININVNINLENNNNIHNKNKSKLKSSDRLIFLEDYFKNENKFSYKRQKRIFSEFKPNMKFENKFYYSNLKISSNVNNFCFIPESRKIANEKNIRKKKISNKKKKNLNLQISQNIEIEIFTGNNLEENSNDDKEKLKFFKENFIENKDILILKDGKKENNEIKNNYICASCGHKNFIVD